ncbi:hypothetical protein MLD38_022486 [Melastoma candidum]|uniref:Uncharacterized protein n=1 Tax=Melastoma candidum TaxID=119954 RepID=A0ACB9QJK8_9MYRT|nr:hypothetical protein MLD38_022486 [Melastoma candidum]
MQTMGRRMWGVFLALTVCLLSGFCPTASASPHPVVGVIGGAVSNVASVLVKWLWSLSVEHTPLKTAVSSRSMVKFESGYTVETVFDGSKLGIGPHSVEVSSSGELLVLDSDNSNVYRVSFPLSKYSRPKLIAGSPEGYSGHVDGKPREARMNHPKGLTMDDRGNVYIADTMNMAIRKISDMGITTIAGGKWGRGGGGVGHVDGPSEEAKFSDDFDIAYVASSCSLLVVDRGNQAIREIQLHDEDCSGQSYNSTVPFLGMAMLAAAGFFGYMLALLQRRAKAIFSSPEEIRFPMKKLPKMAAPQYQKLPPRTVRPPLVPPEDEPDMSEEGLFSSIGKLVVNTGSTMGEIVQRASPWSVQESFAIPQGDEPPSPPLVDSRTPTPKRSYPFAPEDIDRSHRYGQGHGQAQYMQRHHQHNEMMQRQGQHQHHHRHHAVNPQTFYESSCETNEIVFGAVQEHDGRREAMVIKAVDYSDPRLDHRNNIRSRINYMGYSHGC